MGCCAYYCLSWNWLSSTAFGMFKLSRFRFENCVSYSIGTKISANLCCLCLDFGRCIRMLGRELLLGLSVCAPTFWEATIWKGEGIGVPPLFNPSCSVVFRYCTLAFIVVVCCNFLPKLLYWTSSFLTLSLCFWRCKARKSFTRFRKRNVVIMYWYSSNAMQCFVL